jgi:uncharacterized protein YndB with AHSA1/START domain
MAAASSRTATVELPTDEEILITREFDASRHLVYRAWTTPELVKRWWSGGRGEVLSVEIDLRVGGAWRYVLAAGEGPRAAFHGEFTEIVPDERIVHTEVFEGMPDARALTTVTFAETGGRTTLSILVHYGNAADRDAHATYMEDGLQDALDLLEQTALSLPGRRAPGDRDPYDGPRPRRGDR